MALSSSLEFIITISFFLFILSGHAVRDFPKHNNISDDIDDESAGYVKIATTNKSRSIVTWETECYNGTHGVLSFGSTHGLIVLEASEQKTDRFCIDYFEFKVKEKNLVTGEMHTAGGNKLRITFSYDKATYDSIRKHGVSVYLYKENWREACDQKKKESGFQILKEVEETLEMTF